MVKRAPSGAGWKRFLSAGRQCRFLLVLLPKWAAPRPNDLHAGGSAGKVLLPGPPQVSGGGPAARGSGLGLRLPGSPSPPVRRISCRWSRAPGAAPSDRTTRARGRGRPPPRGFDVCGAPAGSPRRAATLVAPGLREGASRLRAEEPGAPAAPSASGAGRIHFGGIRAHWTFPSFPFYFYIFILQL